MEEKSARWARRYLAILATIVLLRLLTLGMPDLIDTTEGRYASTSQLMIERNDWVTPWIIFKGIEKPYLGKPPLHFWLINSAYELFGLSNFTARLPSTLSAIAIGLSLFYLTLPLFGRRAAFVSALVFSSSLLTFYLGGACVLDVTLTAGITAAIAGFALADRSRIAGYICFAGLGLGVLVKGPVGIIFFGMAVGPWALLRRGITGAWPAQMRALPWISGMALFVAISLPWYLLAEARNPGFLEYFIFSENLGRFTKADYGDEYGTGHKQFRGAAWLMMIPSLVPWSLALIGTLIEQRKSISLNRFLVSLKNDQWLLLAVTWTISCPLLLLFARQYTPTYNMTSIPGFAFLMAVLWKHMTDSNRPMAPLSRTTMRIITATMGLTLSIASIVFYSRSAIASETELGFGIFVGLVLLVLSIRMPKFKDTLSPIGALSVITVAAYCGILFSSDSYLSSHRSTRNIIKYAASLQHGEHLKIGFANNLPFSARFYGALMNKPTVTVSQINNDALSEATEDLIIVRKNKGDTDMVMSDSTKERIGELGRWRIYRRIQPSAN